MYSKKVGQKGGNCGAGVCSLQMGGRRRTITKTKKQSGRGCGCQGASTVRSLQMGGRRKSKKSRKSHKRGGAIASGSEVSLMKK
jgi:hypothetical protein